MNKTFLIIYENNKKRIFKTYGYFKTQKEAIKHFNDNNAKYGYKIIAIRAITSSNIYL